MMNVGWNRRLWLLLVASVCLMLPAAAQNSLDPGHVTEDGPTVTYEQKWPVADPSWYQITVSSTGEAKYTSKGHTKEGEEDAAPYTLNFVTSAENRNLIFQLAQDLNRFGGNFETKAKVAQTGQKTLTFRDGSKESSTTLNYSDNPQMNQLIAVFQKMSSTFEMAQKLDFDIRFDKLGLDRDLKALEREDHDNQLAELQVIAPTLERIANDNGVMNIARQRARRLLDKSRAAGSGRGNK